MADRKEAILTDTQRRYLSGEKDVSDSNGRNKDGTIRENTHAAVYDLAHLFRHGEDKHFSHFSEGYEPEGDDDELIDTAPPEEPIIGMVPDGVVGSEGSPHEGERLDPDNDINPETRSVLAAELEQHSIQIPEENTLPEELAEDIQLEEQPEQDKAMPKTQRALVDAVASLCRAADAGSLDVHEVLARGVERYYRAHPEKDRRIANVKTWKEDTWGDRIKADYKGSVSDDIPKMGEGIFRFLAREGYDL